MLLAPRSVRKFVGAVKNWPSALLLTMLKRRELINYKLKNGFSFSVRTRTGDSKKFDSVFIIRSFDPNEYGFDFRWQSARTIVDIGAHIGCFTLFAASHSPTARIISLEPEPSNFSMLQRNIESNGLSIRAATENIGMGSGENVPLIRSREHLSSDSISRSEELPLIIPTITLTGLFDRYSVVRCDYLKLDCEGAEYDALYSMPDEYLSRIRCIGVACHHLSLDPTHTVENMQIFLEGKNFRVKRRKMTLIAMQ